MSESSLLPTANRNVTREQWQHELHGSRQRSLDAHGIAEGHPYTFDTFPYAKASIAALGAAAWEKGGQWAVTSIEAHENDIRKTLPPSMETPHKVVLDRLLATSPWRRALLQEDSVDEMQQALVETKNLTAARYRNGLQQAISDGYFPSKLLDRYDRAIAHTAVRTASSLLNKVGKELFGGYYDSFRDEIVAFDVMDSAGEENGELSERVDTLGHEQSHNISGGTFQKKGEGAARRMRVGFSNSKTTDHGVSSEESKNAWNEATNQIVNLGILTGDFETLDPDKRSDGNKTRYGYRKVLSAFYEKAGGVLKVATLTHAFVEDTAPGQGFSARKAFVKEFIDAYGWGAVRAAEELMLFTDLYSASPEKILQVTECIVPPELDESGAVVKKGYIDWNKLPALMTQEEILEQRAASGQSFGDFIANSDVLVAVSKER